ncbi:MAG: beta-ketoacyl synthase chain length factor [Burkholderiales bacterium]
MKPPANMRAFVKGIGFVASGIASWDAACEIVAARRPYTAGPLPAMSPDILPPAERRRAGVVIRLALTVAQQALAHARAAPGELASVFASAWGDSENVHQICLALATSQTDLSPTRFHNSVQNAPSGYWSIATRSHAASNTVNGLDSVFAIGLLEAAVQVHVEARDVLLVCYDVPMPEPLSRLHPLGASCGVAMLLGAHPGDASLAVVDVARIAGRTLEVATIGDSALEGLRNANPAARALPLLQAIANGKACRLGFDLDPYAMLQVDVNANPGSAR